MKIHLSKGFDDICFGMTRSEVKEIIGSPNHEFLNPDNNIELFWEYTEKKLTLTFYLNEFGRLGYIRSSNTNLSISECKIIDTHIEVVQNQIDANPNSWEINKYFSFTAYFHEGHWLCLNVKYDKIIDIELGVPLKNDNEYDWKLN
jgi:hypothetical protein